MRKTHLGTCTPHMVLLGVCGQKRGLEKIAKHSMGIGLEKIRNESLQQNLTGDIIFVHIRYVFVKLWTKTKPTKTDVLRLIQLFSQTLSDPKKQTSLWKTTYSKLLNDVYMSRHPHTPSRWNFFKMEIETFFDYLWFFRLGKTDVSLKNDLSREIMRGRCTSNCS